MNIRKIIQEEIESVFNSKPEVIEIDWDEGSVFGVIHFDRKHINNWIENEHVKSNLDAIPDDELFPIGILKNINVNEEFRNQGYGNDLMESFISECSHCSYIILIADISEENNFNIIDWYKSFGFYIFGESLGNPVMLKDINESTIKEIDLSVNSNPGAKPGIIRKFPDNKKGGDSLNINTTGGPRKFPK